MVPELKETSLVSMDKLADAIYVSIFDMDKVSIYDMTNTEIIVTRGAILKGWRDKPSGLWRTPLKKTIQNENTDTVLVSKLHQSIYLQDHH